jgi:carbamoyl-phosphate synthase large subunit
LEVPRATAPRRSIAIPSIHQMKKPLNVLIFPAGMENGLEIRKALQSCKEVRLFGASSPDINQAFYVYQDVSIIRDVRTPGWLDDLNAAIDRHGIDIVFPANSTVIDHLSPVREHVKAQVLLPSHEVIQITRSKRATLALLKNVLPTPVVYESFEDIKAFPAFAKPDRGYGSQGIRLVESVHEASHLDFDTLVVQEHLPGKEYTVDCFSDMEGRLVFSGARERVRIRMGTSMHAELVPPELESRLRAYAEAILGKLKITGAWFFQVKEDRNGTLRLLEVDVRIAGTMCFHRARGVNFSLLSILQSQGHKIGTLVNTAPLTLDRCLHNRYRLDYEYDAVYVDLDDTLVIHAQLNIELIGFLYQCVNRGKKVVLISKHLGSDIRAYLRQWRIESLFDDIIWLKEEQSKADHIAHERAIFIDDSFSQRAEVVKRIGIPTFDSSMVEALIDDRI